MCHEPTSVGLPESIGVGKGTVELEDFDHCDLVLCIGHNPGTNHPRMLGTLREVSKRGATIVAINPLRERGLERFTSPQSPIEMLSMSSTELASTYYKVRVGGDAAMLKGVMKILLTMHEEALSKGEPGVIDEAFITEHTEGFDALKADLESTDWEHILKVSAWRVRRSSISPGSTPVLNVPSSVMAWELPNTSTVLRTCSKSLTCC